MFPIWIHDDPRGPSLHNSILNHPQPEGMWIDKVLLRSLKFFFSSQLEPSSSFRSFCWFCRLASNLENHLNKRTWLATQVQTVPY